MWIPTDIEQFEAAVREGALEEKHDFDAKRQLPENGKELAKDIAAMTTDGGSLVYGVGEDENGQPRILSPFKLAGAAERIDQIAQHSVSGSFRIEFEKLRCKDDSARGYLIATIHPSPLAPHQVTVGNDRRFYGRSDSGNRRLSEEEVARLYERRQLQNVDREKLLADCVAASPLGQPTAGEAGFLQAFAQPALREDDLWDRAIEASQEEEQILLKDLRDAVASVSGPRWGGADLTSALNWRQRGADKWTLDSGSVTDDPAALPPHRRALADLSMDGRCYLFHGGAAADSTGNHTGQPVFLLYERGIAITLAQFLTLVGALYRAADQHGPIDVGIAVTGIREAVSAHFHQDRMSPAPYQDEGAYRTERVDAAELKEDPVAVSRRLLDRLWRAMSGGYSWDPLAAEE